ncbi:MAG: hypothetical protein LUF26_08125 [Firmicutes bacterium]|nr:hypothetical protein [Bacillota bacterium]
MKKVLSIIAAIVLCVSVCSCGSSPEEELERAKEASREAQESYKKASRDYDNLKKDLDELDSMQSRIKNAK